MAAFAAGHLAYGAEFLAPGVRPPAIPALALIALALSTEAWLAPRTGALRWPVRGYVAVITLMALAALTLPSSRWPALLGALLFLASDLLLALELFVLPGGGLKRAAGRALWAAYWSGQALILWGMVPPAAP
ncbi:lysoplasmalogenase family protein, partial [Albidovulum sp.]|uniref:lysoplasmalogenase family protein n=1 Tax=Albidovulum sp. TaxID=1872424 RepID=UPI0039B96ECE